MVSAFTVTPSDSDTRPGSEKLTVTAPAEMSDNDQLPSRLVVVVEPSVATIFTGHYPTVHGAYGTLANVAPIRAELPMLTEILSDAGYHTVAVVNGFFLSPKLGFDRGFELFDYFSSSNLDIRRADESIDVALEYVLRRPPDAPLFLLLHLFDPHMAYDPPPPWASTSIKSVNR